MFVLKSMAFSWSLNPVGTIQLAEGSRMESWRAICQLSTSSEKRNVESIVTLLSFYVTLIIVSYHFKINFRRLAPFKIHIASLK